MFLDKIGTLTVEDEGEEGAGVVVVVVVGGLFDLLKGESLGCDDVGSCVLSLSLVIWQNVENRNPAKESIETHKQNHRKLRLNENDVRKRKASEQRVCK